MGSLCVDRPAMPETWGLALRGLATLSTAEHMWECLHSRPERSGSVRAVPSVALALAAAAQ